MNAEKIFLYFFIFSISGWFYESFLCTTFHKNPFRNKGFLMGPYCPIYGIGATASIILFGNFEDTFLLFISSALFCGVLEYLSSFSLEKLFHEKWWDYSHCSFHLHGRICLYGVLTFGAVNVVICRFVAPQLDKMMNLAGSDILSTLSLLLMTVLVIDITWTLIYRKNLNQNLCLQYKKIHLEIDQRMKNAFEFLLRKKIPNIPLTMLSHRKM